MNTTFTRRAPVASTTLALALLASLVLLLPAPARANGYTLHTLYNFTAPDSNGHNADGTGATGLTSDGQGHFFGSTLLGGPYGLGTLFEFDTTTKTFTTLVGFNGVNGAYGYGGVTTDGQGHLYGSTSSGGSSNHGTIYEYDLASNTFTTLMSFNATNGLTPMGGVIPDGQGHLYGTTKNGGSDNKGLLFEFDLKIHALTTLVTFNGMNGRTAQSPLVLDGQGNLYGTTSQGGSSNKGKVFQYNLARHVFTTLVSFTGTNGQFPSGYIALDGQGHLYGTTNGGYGSLYKINLATHYLTTLAAFNSTTGAEPNGITLDGQGHLFGATADSNSNKGTVFKMKLANHALTVLVSFTGGDGAYPYGAPALDGNGNLFGATSNGGANSNGTIYELTPNP